MRILRGDPLARDSTRTGLRYLEELFGGRARPGVEMAVRAMDPAVPAERVEGICAAFVREVHEADL